MDKINKTLSSFKSRLSSGKKEIPLVSVQIDQEEKDTYGTDKMVKAISFFKQRRGNKKDIPGVLLQNKLAEIAEVTAEARETTSEINAISLQNNYRQKDGSHHDMHEANDKEKLGWISPTYSQSRSARLDMELIGRNRCSACLDGLPETDAYRVLRSQILQRTRESWNNTIMVTSALPGEGKTLTAINLAFTIAREFQHTVLLVDGDLRKQSIHKYLGCPGEKGLIDYLADGVPVSELIVWPGVEKMTFISGGQPYPESAEILGSPRMKELVSDLKGRYPERYVIFDAPPVLAGADAQTLAPLLDLVILVVRAGKTSMDNVRKAIQFLPKEKILGLVLNRC